MTTKHSDWSAQHAQLQAAIHNNWGLGPLILKRRGPPDHAPVPLHGGAPKCNPLVWTLRACAECVGFERSRAQGAAAERGPFKAYTLA